MKFCKISLLFVIFALICSLSLTFAEDEAPAAAPSPALKRPLRRPVGKAAKATTTTTAAPPAYDDEGDYAEENQEGGEPVEDGEEAAVSSTTTTTTEAPKKVIRPVVRPFRSNDDFLNSLKRRRMNAKKHLSEKPTPKSRPAAEQNSDEEGEVSAPAPAAPSKGFKAGSSIASRRKLLKPTKQEPVEDTAAEESEPEKEESKLKRPLNARLSLRKRT